MNNLSLLKKAHDKRLSFIPSEDTCCRVINGDVDGFPGVTADLYGKWILLQYFTPEGAGLAREISPLLYSEFFPEIEIQGVLLKDRTKDAAPEHVSELVAGNYPPSDYTVIHNGLRAQVDLVNAQNTGVFMDMRRVRQLLLPYYRHDGRLLNLFSYTSLFSVHALCHGMLTAENVDLSNVVLERSKQNYKLNGLTVNDRDFIRADSLSYIKQAARKKRIFDMVIIDPPTFSRYKGTSFSAQRDMGAVLSTIDEITRGYVLSAINSHRVSREEYQSYHPASWENIFIEEESADFRGSFSYLKVGLWQVN